ncbi:hypothetical protein [Flavobacterium sp. CAU 1735]|uniref:hypothetical protein n=1 Tax=Flavobacterium sp. CAU 1735 TaxID=3140361 RepID=UPI003260BF57
MKKIILIMSLVSMGSAYKVPFPIKPVSFIETHKSDTSKIRFNGFYNTLDTAIINRQNDIYFGKSSHELYSSLYLVIFGRNKKIYIDGVETFGNKPFTCEYYKRIRDWNKLHKEEYLGNYTIKNDSIYAHVEVRTVTSAGRIKSIYCNYRGYIKNKDTITDWKVIAPYPKDFTKFVIEKNQWLFKSKTLYFVKTDAVKCLQMD